MAVNISYKCPNCGAELFWSADKNCWACEYCDGQFTLKDLEEAGGDAKKAEELNKDNVEKHEEVDKDEYSMSNDGTVGNDLVKYTCSHCGDNHRPLNCSNSLRLLRKCGNNGRADNRQFLP